MGSPEPEIVPPNKIAEVRAFLRAAREFAEWKARHPKALAELLAIAEVYNPTLKAAEKAVRERRVSSGPFELYSFRTNVDGAALCATVGRHDFVRLGGVIESIERFTIDTDRFKGLVAREEVGDEVVKRVVTLVPNYHKPDPISVP